MRKKYQCLNEWYTRTISYGLYHLPMKRFLLAFVFLIINLFLFNVFTYSQNVSASVDRDKILIGEQVVLQLKVTNLDRSSQDIDKWFNVPDSFNHMEVVKRLPIDTTVVEGVYTYSQIILLTSFDSGYWQIPPVDISFTNKKSAKTLPLGISVLPVDVSGLKDYHEFKDIIEVKPETDWWLTGEIVLGVIILVIAAIVLFRYFKKRKLLRPAALKKFGIEEVMKQIDGLQKKGLITQRLHKQFFTELIDICRSFSDRQLNISSANKTTDEYMLLLKGKIGNEPSQISYFQLLRLADAVKFAKFIPDDKECDEALITARNFVQTIYQFQFQKRN